MVDVTRYRPSVGIIVPSNNQAGAQKLAAICAADLSKCGFKVRMFIPRLPYFYYFVTLKKKPLTWLKTVRHYVIAYLRNPHFVFRELVGGENGEHVSTRNILRIPLRKRLSGLDCLIVMTIAQIAELKGRFPQEKTLYYILHPEERVYGHYDLFRKMRLTFKGKMVALSPWTAGELKDDLPDLPVVPAVISPVFYNQRRPFQEAPNPDKDILFHYCSGGNKACGLGSALLKMICEKRPGTTFTLWTRDVVPSDFSHCAIQIRLSEEELRQQYLTHKLLLFPSTWEGFGIPPIEAIACGCLPILHSGVGAADLYVRDGENSLVIEPDLDKTAMKVAALLDNPAKLDHMRLNARESIEQFNPDGYGLRLLEAAGIKVGGV